MPDPADRSVPATGSVPFNEDQALALDVLAQPVMFHRAYVGVTGSVTAALWLCYATDRRAQAATLLQRSGQSVPQPLWFSFSREECEAGTGMSRAQQDTARKEIRARGLIQERRRGTTEIAINWEVLGSLLRAQARREWRAQLPSVATVTDMEQAANTGQPAP